MMPLKLEKRMLLELLNGCSWSYSTDVPGVTQRMFLELLNGCSWRCSADRLTQHGPLP
jgi:hypothetical protein